MSKAAKKKLNIILNFTVIIFSLWGILSAVFNLWDCDHDRWNWGWKVFKYYTNDSNMIGSLSCLFVGIFHIKNFKEDKPLPLPLVYFKLIGASMMLFTFLTVVATLGNAFTFWALFGWPSTLFLHTLSPLLCVFTFLYFDQTQLKRKFSLLSLIPVLIYSLTWLIVLLILNLPPEVEADSNVCPYFFLAIHNQPWYISMLWMMGLTIGQWLVCFILLLIKNLITKKTNK